MLQALNILEHAPRNALALGSPPRLVWIAEALRIAHRNRRADPVSDYQSARASIQKKIGKHLAKELADTFERPGSSETTHFSVVDRQGMAVGVTQSLNNYYGAKVANPVLGFLYNDYMKEFEIGRPNHPFALRPNAPPASSMSATVISRGGEVGMVLGSPGSARIISAVVQVISHWVDTGQGIEAAVAAPRLHVVPQNNLYDEANSLPESLLVELKRRGFKKVEPEFGLTKGGLDPYFGGVHAIAREASSWRGAADPRRDGVVSYAVARAAR